MSFKSSPVPAIHMRFPGFAGVFGDNRPARHEALPKLGGEKERRKEKQKTGERERSGEKYGGEKGGKKRAGERKAEKEEKGWGKNEKDAYFPELAPPLM